MRTSSLLLLTGLSLLAASCQSFRTSGATHEEKTAALAAHLAKWEGETLVNQFAAPRTIQLFSDLTLDPTSNRISAKSTGLATLLTPDGYALTATHVLDDGTVSILQLRYSRPGKLLLTKAGAIFKPRGDPDQAHRVANRHLKSGPIRLVHRFPGADLTLVQLPMETALTFDLAARPPASDTTVFSYGSSLSGSSSAGEIRRVRQKRETWQLTTSVPLRKGDSGGPLMDPAGRLVGIISRGQTRPFSTELRATIANGVPLAAVQELIARDRNR